MSGANPPVILLGLMRYLPIGHRLLAGPDHTARFVSQLQAQIIIGDDVVPFLGPHDEMVTAGEFFTRREETFQARDLFELNLNAHEDGRELDIFPFEFKSTQFQDNPLDIAAQFPQMLFETSVGLNGFRGQVGHFDLLMLGENLGLFGEFDLGLIDPNQKTDALKLCQHRRRVLGILATVIAHQRGGRKTRVDPGTVLITQ